jgi:hypothetical protein
VQLSVCLPGALRKRAPSDFTHAPSCAETLWTTHPSLPAAPVAEELGA